MRFNLLLLLFLVWGMGGCYVYKPLEKTTRSYEVNLSEEENLFRQFFYLKAGEGIQVTTKRGRKVSLEFLQVSQDTLYANYKFHGHNGPVKVPLSDIQEAKRLKYSKGLSFIAEAFSFLIVTTVNLLINGELDYSGEED